MKSLKKKLIVLLCMGAPAVCHADGYVMPVLVSAPDTCAAQTITGTVASVTIADNTRQQRPEIVIAGPAGKQHRMIIKKTTTLYDPAWKPTSIDMLRKDDHVKVKYVRSGKGIAETLTIKKYNKQTTRLKEPGLEFPPGAEGARPTDDYSCTVSPCA